MSASSPPREEAFPELTEPQRGRIAAFARERRFADGEMLWEQGDCNRPLYVVLEGKIAILSGTDHLVVVHEPGEFSGDVDLLSGRPVVVRGRATGETRVLKLPGVLAE
jgi:thioredoxin reductase (NADPH)